MITYSFNLNESQRKKLAHFINNTETSIRLLILHDDLIDGKYPLYISDKTKQKIDKNIKNNFGLILKLTKTNIKNSLKAGYLDKIANDTYDELDIKLNKDDIFRFKY